MVVNKAIKTLQKIQLENRQHMNSIIEGLSRCHKYAITHNDEIFAKEYTNQIQGDIHKFYDACVEIVGGDYNQLLTEFDGKININIYEDTDE